MVLASGEAARNAGTKGSKNKVLFPPSPESLLVHFSNLHNFTVTLHSRSEEKSMTARSLFYLR